LHPGGPIPGRVARGRLIDEWPGAARTRVHQVARLLIGNSLRKVAARWRWLQHLLWLTEAVFFALFLGVCRVLPADTATAFGRNLLRWIGPRQAKQRIVRRNLQLAFPEKSEQEIESLARGVWGGAGSLLAEYSHVGEICEAADDPRIECVFAGEVPEFHDHSTPKVFVSAHLGNWEFIAAALIRHGVPLTAIYTPMQNPWLERLLARCRRPLGCRLVARDESMRPLIRELNEGRSIGLLMDQRVDSGRPIPMFGIDKWTTLVPARLALKHGCPIIPARTERLQGARFRVTIYPPVMADDPGASQVEQAEQITMKINGLFEGWIRERPEDWFCTKRRFPKDAVPPTRTQPPAETSAQD
jgi:KDO2-lipid IV(A) lauroyltransferase